MKINVLRLSEAVGLGYAEWRGRYLVVKGSRASKKSKTAVLNLIYCLLAYPESNGQGGRGWLYPGGSGHAGAHQNTTYVMGAGAFAFEDIGAKVPVEMDRDPGKNGGEDTLYVRQRKVFAPYGISYEKKVQASLSPTDAELKNGSNWALVHSGEAKEADRDYINHKAIPIARIISRG